MQAFLGRPSWKENIFTAICKPEDLYFIVLPLVSNGEEWLTVHQPCGNTRRCVLSAGIPLGSLEFSYVSGRQCLCEQPKGTPENWLSQLQQLLCVTRALCWRREVQSVWLCWEDGLHPACAWFPPPLSSQTLLFHWLFLASFHDNQL